MQDRKLLYLVLHFALFFIPINLYVIGDWLGVGIQWILFRYQSTYLGDSLITVEKYLMYVISNTIGGRTAVALSIEFLAAIILIISLMIQILNYLTHVNGIWISGVLILAGGIILLLADIIQYGILLNSMAGFCIPIGIPFIFVFGWIQYRESQKVSVSEWWNSVKLSFSKS